MKKINSVKRKLSVVFIVDSIIFLNIDKYKINNLKCFKMQKLSNIKLLRLL